MNAMSPRHLLGEAVFDVAFASEEEAFAHHLELGSHVRQRLLAVIDEVFDEVAGGGLVYRFDAIEIDLGELPRGDYQEAMARRLRERLRAHLMARLPAGQAEPTPGVRAVSQQHLELEQLEHFLTHGRLPWNTGHDEVDTLERRAWEVLRASGADFLEFLKNQFRAGESVTRRLIAQFPDALLIEIAGRLAPTQSSLIAALAGELGRVTAANQLTPARAREIRQRVWSALLEGLLQTDGRTFSAAGMIAMILERMAQQAGRRAPGAEKAQGGAAKTALENFAAGIAALLATGTAPAALRSEGWGEDAGLEAALLHGGDGEIESAWRNALRRHPDLLRETLRRHGASALLRARLAGILPDPLLLETVHYLEPEGSRFVTAVIGEAGHFRALLASASGDQAGIRQQLWTFTLGYLAVERGAAFSGKAYLDSLIRQSAAHTALSRREVVARLQQALEQGEASGPPLAELAACRTLVVDSEKRPQRGQFLPDLPPHSPAMGQEAGEKWSAAVVLQPTIPKSDRLLARLLSELAQAPPPPAPDAERRSRELMRGYDLLDQLREGLRGTLEADADLSAAVAELAESHPWAWSQLHRELRSGAFSSASQGAGLAPRAGDRARYYRQVLLGLVLSRSVDLELSEAEAEAMWVSVEESVWTGKDGALDERASHPPPAASQAALAGWKKETLERLVDRLPGGPHSRIHLLLRNAGPRAALAPGRRVYGDLVGSIGAGSKTDEAEKVAVQPVAIAPKKFARSCSAGVSPASFNPAGETPALQKRPVSAVRFRRAEQSPGMTPIPRRNAGGEGLAETPLAAAGDLPPTRAESLPLRADESGLPLAGIPKPDRLLVAALKRGPVTGAGEVESLSRGIQVLLEAEPDRLEALLAELRQHGAALERLVSALPERLLTRLLFRLRGAEHHEIQACADTLTGACGFSELGAESLRDAKWRFILDQWLGQGLLFDQRGFVRQFAHTLAEQAGWLDQRRFRFLLHQQLGLDLPHTLQPSPPPAREATHRLAARRALDVASENQTVAADLPPTRAEPLPLRADESGLPLAGIPKPDRLPDQDSAAQAHGLDQHPARTSPSQPSATKALSRNREIILAVRAALEDRDGDAVPARPVQVVRESAEARGEDIYIDNAGLVLVAPYLPRLFAMLDLLDGPAFRDAAAAERAVRLLQYLVDGGENVDEFRLVLNKILCGLATDTLIEREAGFSEQEKEAAEGLLRGMIDNWKGIGHTSVAGLRETFLRREGRLRLKDGAWNLLVAPKPFDMLLDTLPWSIAVIKHHWMNRVIHVEWR